MVENSANDRTPKGPAVSVIVPAYRVADYIAEALESVLAQTFTDYEIIVINDGCPDTPALEHALRYYRDRIVYVKKENGGLASARNAGIRASRAELIALLDGDDAWTPDYLAVQVEFLRTHPTADVVYPNGVFFGNTPLAGRFLMDLSPSNGEVTFESLVSLRCSVIVSVTARKAALLQVGGFDEQLRRVEDFDLWLRIVKAGSRIVYHTTPLFRYRRRDTSLSADSTVMLQSVLEVLDKAERTLDLSQSERQALERTRLLLHTELAYFAGKHALQKGDCATAVLAFQKVNQYRWRPKLAVLIVLLKVAPRLTLNLTRRLAPFLTAKE